MRDTVASLFRSLPSIRGKARLGAALGRVLSKKGTAAHQVTVRMRDGSMMPLDLRDHTHEWAYWTGEYDCAILMRLLGALERGCIVFDVGANVGLYTVPIGRKVQEMGGTVYAFEPVQSNYDHMRRALALNKLETTVRTYPVALGDEEGTVSLYLQSNDESPTGNAVLVKGDIPAERGNTTARITRLDTFVEEIGIPGCHLIKVDVEGAEYMFLRGGAGFIQKHRPVICGEFNHLWMKRFGHSFLDVVELMRPWNYNLYKQTSADQFLPIAAPTAGMEDVLMVPQETSPEGLARMGVRV
jgi:FkbM family methyltransferase